MVQNQKEEAVQQDLLVYIKSMPEHQLQVTAVTYRSRSALPNGIEARRTLPCVDAPSHSKQINSSVPDGRVMGYNVQTLLPQRWLICMIPCTVQHGLLPRTVFQKAPPGAPHVYNLALDFSACTVMPIYGRCCLSFVVLLLSRD